MGLSELVEHLSETHCVCGATALEHWKDEEEPLGGCERTGCLQFKDADPSVKTPHEEVS